MIVLDSSAIIAVILDEKGSDVVRDAFNQAVISTCNVAEVYTKILQLGLGHRAPDAIFGSDSIDIVPLSLSQAKVAGDMVVLTGKAGLSLGDRCCLALAKEIGVSVLTADRPWAQFADALGIEIRLIR